MHPISVIVSVPVSDLDASTAWYRRALDLGAPEVIAATGIVQWAVGATSVQLFDAPDDAGGEGMALSFRIADLRAQRDRLLELGLPVSEIERVEGVVDLFFLTDPDGNTICFVSTL